MKALNCMGSVMRRGCPALLLVVAPAWAGARTDAPAPTMDVVHYAARIDPDNVARTLRGEVLISLVLSSAGAQPLEFDAGELTVDQVSEQGADLAFERRGSKLQVRLPAPASPGDRHEIRIRYHGAPRFGLEFHPERGELYTIFSTSQWLVCVDAPSERASLDLSVALPAGLEAIGNGRLVSKRSLDAQRDLYHWRLDAPASSYIYGFAAGHYWKASTRAAGVELNYLSTDLDAGQLRRLFTDTGDMLRFFARRAGLRYRGSYSQALVSQTIGQELAGFSLLSEAYGQEVLADPAAEALIAHELAHQWWGNRITCADWGHFWLNEGFANFMTAAYLQRRFGEPAYLKQVEGWRLRLEKLRAEGKDRPLLFAEWAHPTRDDRAVVYQKGAYVLHLLRQELGEKAFWRGIRDYTRGHDGRSVTTADFQRAMERASGRDLSEFFASWVYGPAAAAGVS